MLQVRPSSQGLEALIPHGLRHDNDDGNVEVNDTLSDSACRLSSKTPTRIDRQNALATTLAPLLSRSCHYRLQTDASTVAGLSALVVG